MLALSFYRNSQNAIVGDLFDNQRRLLSCSHPATLAASLFAMARQQFVIRTERGTQLISFPVQSNDLPSLQKLIDDETLAAFMSGFASFSCVDFASPAHAVEQTAAHFWAAVRHLPVDLVKVKPSQACSEPDDIEERERYIYYPVC